MWLKYTLLTAYMRLMTEIQFFSLYHSVGRPILSEDKSIFSSTITSKIFGKQHATAAHTS
jgi:hypothetical protein